MSRGPTHEEYDEWDLERSRDDTSISVSGEPSLPKGRYATLEFESDVPHRGAATVEVVERGHVDVFVVGEEQYSDYREADENFEYIPQHSETDTDEAHPDGIFPQHFFIVVDNTPVYGAKPERDVDLSVSVDLRYPE